MAIPTIPEFLREPMRKGFIENPVKVWRENATEIGPPIRAKLYDNAPSIFKVTWVLDELEFAAFDGWFKTIIDQGTSPFIIPLRTGFGVTDHECTFKSKNPPYKMSNKKTVITAVLEARFKQFDTDENIQDLLDALQDQFDTGDPRPSETLAGFSAFMQSTLPNLWSGFL